MKAIRLVTLVILMFLVLELSLMAQTSQGRILGTVVDLSGAVVPQVRVTVENTATGVSRTVVTTSAGDYTVPNLDPGMYTISVEAAGFKKTVSTPILLEVSREVRVELKLQPGMVTETMVVTAEGALVDTTNTTLNGVLSNKAISELPVQGRDFQNLRNSILGYSVRPAAAFTRLPQTGIGPMTTIFSLTALTTTTRITAKPWSMTPAFRALQQAFCRSMPSRNSTLRRVLRRIMASSPAWS